MLGNVENLQDEIDAVFRKMDTPWLYDGERLEEEFTSSILAASSPIELALQKVNRQSIKLRSERLNKEQLNKKCDKTCAEGTYQSLRLCKQPCEKLMVCVESSV